MWLQHTPRFARPAVALALALVTAAPHTVLTQDQAPLRGVVVEEVGKGSAGEKAGIRPGDVLLSWVRAAAPPANPDEPRGEIASPFDFADIELEQAPRGTVTLLVTRNGANVFVTVPPGAWAIAVRPAFGAEMLSRYQQGRDLLVKEIDKALSVWRDLAVQADAANDRELAAWLLFRVGDALAAARRWDEAHAGYQAAIAAVKDHGGAPAVLAAIWEADGTAFERQSNFPRAEAAYGLALELREKASKEGLAVAAGLTRLGVTALARGDLAAAEQFFKRSHALAEKLGPDGLAVGAALNNLGRLARERGELPVAEDLHRRALAIRERMVPDGLDVASSLNNLGLLAYDRGNLADAESLFTRSLAIWKRLAPDSLTLASTLNNLGLVTYNRGDLSTAEEFHRGALAIREKLVPGSLDVASSLNNLGIVANRRGELDAAEQLHKRSLAIKQRLAPGSRTVATTLINLGIVADRRGDLASAEELYERSLVINEKLAPDSLVVANALNNLGLLAAQRGDVATAEELFRRSLTIKEKLAPASLDVAESLNNLGEVASQHGDLDSAEQFFTRSLAIQEKRAPDSLVVAVTLKNLGDVAHDRGDVTVAGDLHGRSLELRQKLAPDSLSVAEILIDIARAARSRNDLAAAEQSYLTALELWQKLAPGSAGEAAVLHDLGLLALVAGRREVAADYLQRALTAIEAQTSRLGGAEEVRSGFAARFIDYYRNYIDLMVELDLPAMAFQALERSRARSLLAMLAERDLVFADDLPADLARERTLINAEHDRTQAAIARLNPAKDGAELDRQLARMRELRDKREQVAQAIRKASPRFASLIYPQPLDLAGARRSLDAGTVLLAYSVGREKTFLLVVQPERPVEPGAPAISAYTLPIGEAALRDKVTAVRSLIQRGAYSSAPADAALTAGQELFAMLIEPARAVIGAGDRLLISPDGPLHTLPFAALVDQSDRAGVPRYFIEWKPLHVVTSATVYAELKKTRRPSEDAAASPVLAAFGDPVYPPLTAAGADAIADHEVRAAARRGHTLAPLPASRREVESIARIYGDRAAAYLGEQATEERAKAVGKGARYLHFASHGLLDERFPLNSGLALTIPERPREGQANGLLQAWEIFEQMRIDADLVTLSACETGLGKELGGEGLVGLTRAFQYAGARSVLASLWSVGDDSTADLMTRFYGHLKAGRTKDDALRAAQLEMIRAGGSAHPFQWAAFQISGDWR
jgi:CHAT domain-containing protein/Tfp pilus assembly protein PilF